MTDSHPRRVLITLLLLLWAVPVSAHPGSVAFWHVIVGDDEVRSRILVSPDDAAGTPIDDQARDAGDQSRLRGLAIRLLDHFAVHVADVAVPATLTSVRLVHSGHLEVLAVHRMHGRRGPLVLHSTFHEWTDEDHRVIARVERAGTSTPLVFHAGAPRQDLPVPRGTALGVGALLSLGVTHILGGYDHLLFLACLLLPGGTLRSRAVVVSAFTAAHSLTLGLGAARLVVLPERFVEAAIAVSIAYVALANLLGDRARPRWPAAFGFGLLHGLAFAGTLDVLHLPLREWVASVLAFNAGVEAGQLALVAMAMPVLAWSAKRAWYGQAVRYASAGVLALAVFWVAERLS